MKSDKVGRYVYLEVTSDGYRHWNGILRVYMVSMILRVSSCLFKINIRSEEPKNNLARLRHVSDEVNTYLARYRGPTHVSGEV